MRKLPIRKLLLTLLVVGIAGSVCGLGAFSAFRATTTNSGNTITAGSVSVSDNDSGSSMFSLTGMKPSDSAVERCITVTYGGTLTPQDVRLYASVTGNLAQYIDLTIEKGTQTGGSGLTCGTFTNENTLYTGTLQNFENTYFDWSSGLASSTSWSNGTAKVYRVTVDLQNNNSAQGQSSNADFTWEAQSN